MKSIDWKSKVVEDFRERILVDSDSPILAFKANRDRYTNIKNQADYAGLPHLGSCHSEDILPEKVIQKFYHPRQLGKEGGKNARR